MISMIFYFFIINLMKHIKMLLKKSDKADALKALIDATYINDAPDNVTIIIADITSDEITTNQLLGAAQ